MHFPTDLKLHSPFDNSDKYKGNVRFLHEIQDEIHCVREREDEKRLIPIFTRFKYSGTFFTAIS